MPSKPNIDWEAIDRILTDTREDFVSLATAANLDPSVDFVRTDLRDIDFGDCDLAGYNFAGANLAGSDLTKTRIEGAIFTGAKGLDTAKFPKSEQG